MKAAKNSKEFNRNVMPTTKKKAFKKKRKSYYTSKDKCHNFTNFFRRPKIDNSNLSNEKASKASLPVSADLSNDFRSIILETDQRKNYPSWG